MQITRQADYALRAVLYLARLEPGRKEPTSRIAEERHIPPSFLAKIISQLAIAELITTSRGAHGGVALSKSPGEISILEVVEAIDGPIGLNDCTQDPKDCVFGEDCPLRMVWCGTQDELVDRLRATTFAKFIDADLLQRWMTYNKQKPIKRGT